MADKHFSGILLAIMAFVFGQSAMGEIQFPNGLGDWGRWIFV